jgi:uncharacterized protein (TIRG00374 family)
VTISPWVKRLLYWISLLAGLAAFAAVLAYIDFFETFRKVRAAGWPCLAAYTATALLTLVVPAAGWLILMRAEGVRCSFGTALKANLMGFVLNLLTPSMYVGSEPLKVFYVAGITGASKRRVLATIIVSKFQEFAGIVLVMLGTVFFYVSTTEVIGKLDEVILVVLALVFTAGLMLVLYAIVGRLRPSVWIIDRIGRLKFMKERMEKLRVRAIELEYRMYAAFVHRWKTFLVAQTITLASALSVLLRPMVFLWFVPGAPAMRLDSLCMVYIIFTLVHMVQLTPAGLGMHEGGLTWYFATVPDPAFPQETAVAFILMGRLVDVLFALTGGAVLWYAGLMKVARGREQVSMDEAEPGESVPLPDPAMKVLKRVFLAAHHVETGKTRRFVAGRPVPRPAALRIGYVEGQEGFHLLAYGDDDGLMTDAFHRTLEEAMEQAEEEYQVRPAEWEEVKPL